MKKSKMRKAGRKNGLHLTGAVLILIGALSIFPENDTLIHNALQITFVTGCIIFVLGGRLSKKVKCPIVGVIFTLSLACAGNLSAQNYEQQIQAFEESFNKKDITVIQPFLRDSLKFAPLGFKIPFRF